MIAHPVVALAISAQSVITIAAASIAAAGAILAAVISAYSGIHTARRVQAVSEHVQEVHVLVNSRLDKALSEIEVLKQQRTESTAKIDELKATPPPDKP